MTFLSKQGKVAVTDSIWTFRIVLVSGWLAESAWQAELEVDSSTTLEKLHLAIQAAVGFANDHMYAFFIARTVRSRDRQYFDLEEGELDTTCIGDLYPLPKNRKLFYWFDFGDDWMFEISRSRHRPFQPVKKVCYPRIKSTAGVRPEQYPCLE